MTMHDDAARGSRATECTATLMGGMMTTRGSRATGGATISSGAMMKATAARQRRQNRRCNDEGSGGASMKLAAA